VDRRVQLGQSASHSHQGIWKKEEVHMLENVTVFKGINPHVASERSADRDSIHTKVEKRSSGFFSLIGWVKKGEG
jgi:hypothetical protein